VNNGRNVVKSQKKVKRKGKLKNFLWGKLDAKLFTGGEKKHTTELK